MQNTKTEYGSYQRMPVVLPEMEELLPSLSAEQFSALESDILENGCYAPVIVNEDMVIIDGHNRFRIPKSMACHSECWYFRLPICWRPSSGRWIRRRVAVTWRSGSWVRLP